MKIRTVLLASTLIAAMPLAASAETQNRPAPGQVQPSTAQPKPGMPNNTTTGDTTPDTKPSMTTPNNQATTPAKPMNQTATPPSKNDAEMTGMVDPGAIRASSLIGKRVQNGQKETIGSIDDLIVSPDKKVVYAIVSVGGFLGLGDRLVAVSFDKLDARDDGVYIYNVTKDELKSQPEFKWPKT